MKHLLLPLLLLLGLGFVGCSNDSSDCRPPVFQGFRYQPATVCPGDSVFITAVQLEKGHYLNATDYQWKLTVSVEQDGQVRDSLLTYSHHTNYGGLDSSDPTWRLQLPPNTVPGTYACSFNARWSNSADGQGGTYNGGTGQGCTGSITTTSYTLYSQATGSFRLPVRSRQ